MIQALGVSLCRDFSDSVSVCLSPQAACEYKYRLNVSASSHKSRLLI